MKFRAELDKMPDNFSLKIDKTIRCMDIEGMNVKELCIPYFSDLGSLPSPLRVGFECVLGKGFISPVTF